jgi:hypothetical protein
VTGVQNGDRMRTISNKTKADIVKIINLLREHGQMHIRGISRITEIHPMSVSRLIDSYLSPFLEISEIKEFGLKAKIVKLREDKQNITLEDVLRYINIKRKIKNNKTP